MIAIEQLIKIIIGVLVFVVVVAGVFFFFRDQVIEFFKSGEEAGQMILSLIK